MLLCGILADNELDLREQEREALFKIESGSLIDEKDDEALKARNSSLNSTKIPSLPAIAPPPRISALQLPEDPTPLQTDHITETLSALDTKINTLISNQNNILSILSTLQTNLQSTNTNNTNQSASMPSYPSFSELMCPASTATSTTKETTPLAPPPLDTTNQQSSLIFPQLLQPLPFPFHLSSNNTNASLINIPTSTNDFSALSLTFNDNQQQSPITSTPKTQVAHQRPAYFPEESYVRSLYETRPKYNFCVRLLKTLYPEKTDLLNCSVNGGGGKRPLNSCARNYLKDTFFQYYPTIEAEKQKEWRKCTNALNSFLCKYVNTK